VGAFHRGPWICGHPDRLSDPSHSPPRPRESRALCRLQIMYVDSLCLSFCLLKEMLNGAYIYLFPMSYKEQWRVYTSLNMTWRFKSLQTGKHIPF